MQPRLFSLPLAEPRPSSRRNKHSLPSLVAFALLAIPSLLACLSLTAGCTRHGLSHAQRQWPQPALWPEPTPLPESNPLTLTQAPVDP